MFCVKCYIIYCKQFLLYFFNAMCVTPLVFCVYDPVHSLYEHWPHFMDRPLQFHHKCALCALCTVIMQMTEWERQRLFLKPALITLHCLPWEPAGGKSGLSTSTDVWKKWKDERVPYPLVTTTPDKIAF